MGSNDATEPLVQEPKEVIQEIYGNIPVSVEDYTKDYPSIISRFSSEDLTPKVIEQPAIVNEPFSHPPDIYIQPIGIENYSGRYKFLLLYASMLNALPDPQDENSCYVIYPSLNESQSEVDKILLLRFPKEVLTHMHILAQQYTTQFLGAEERYRIQLGKIPIVKVFTALPSRTEPILISDEEPLYSNQGLFTQHPCMQLMNELTTAYGDERERWGKQSTLRSRKDRDGKLHIVVITTKNKL